MATTLFLSLKPLSSPPLSFPSTATYQLTLATLFRHPKTQTPSFFPKIPSASSKNDNNTPAETGCPVPLDQQPINEYQDVFGLAYVGNRLLSATVEYEETGWYDGQIWVKTAEVLARDRLLGSFSVKPILDKLKNTLLILGTLLSLCIILINSDSTRKPIPIPPPENEGRAITRVYNEESARNFEPDAFCGGDSVQP